MLTPFPIASLESYKPPSGKEGISGYGQDLAQVDELVRRPFKYDSYTVGKDVSSPDHNSETSLVPLGNEPIVVT